jgi:hypothetical protein
MTYTHTLTSVYDLGLVSLFMCWCVRGHLAFLGDIKNDPPMPTGKLLSVLHTHVIRADSHFGTISVLWNIANSSNLYLFV